MAMPATQTARDRQPSPNNTTNNNNNITLGSRNPFRNRGASPSGNSLPSPPIDKRMSTNPFLAPSEVKAGSQNVGLTEDIFKDLSLLDQPSTMSNGGPPPSRNGLPPPRPANLPPPRPDASRGPPRPPRGENSPSKRDPRMPRPRGMSESSVMDEKERRERRERRERDGERPERTESEERRRRERRREREERHRREKEKVRNGERKMKKPQGLDIIDKLDVTGIYGQGLFHHDGPFDACNPHRNAKTARRPAPMQAFPADSANMALGGNGPVRSRLDLDKFHGRGEEGFADYAVAPRKPPTTIVNATDRIEQVHGAETHGLGTSTFLEGAPASRAALQRRESEDAETMGGGAPGAMGGGGGLTRKKSLAQRFRGMSAGGRRTGSNGETIVRSPDARYAPIEAASPPIKSVTAGGPARAIYTKENEINPFENEYDSAFDKKGAEIKFAEQAVSGAGSGSGNSPKGGMGATLTRSVTADSAAVRGSGAEDEGGKSGGGFLSRMKSLKGGRRARPERRDT